MSKVKNRKRLSLLAIVFLLAFLAAAAFAFLPGMLDVVGRVGIREGDYVQWVFAATQAAGDSAVVGRAPTAASLGDPLAPGVIRTGFTHTTMAGEVAAAHLGTPAGTGRPAAFEISGNPDPVYLSHARILPETRGRRQQRIEWSVVFEGAATSTLYVQAMNFSETADVVITEARIAEVGAMVVDTVVEDSNFAPFNLDGANPFTDDWHDVTHGATSPITTGTPAHTFPLNAATLHQMFTLGGEALAGGATGLLGTLERNNATLTNTDSSTPISTITLEWDGDFGPLADLLAIELWQFQSTWNATTEQYDHAWVNTGTMERVYTGDSFDGWDADGSGISIFPVLADEDDIFMTTRVWNDVTSDWDLVEFDDLTPWIATFVLEFYYELANG